MRLSAADCLPYSSAAKSTIHIGPTLSENAWAGGFKGDSRTKGRPVYDDILILDNQLAVITQNTAGFKEKPFNKVASEIAGRQLFGSCYFLLVGRKPVKKGMHELYYFTKGLFKDCVSSPGPRHAAQGDGAKRSINMMRYHWNVLPLDQREPFVLGSPVTVVSQPAFSAWQGLY